MYIWVGPGNQCWLVDLMDPDQPPWHRATRLKSFATKEAALEYANKLTSLQVAVDHPSTERR
jgi:hypothetical protein